MTEKVAVDQQTRRLVVEGVAKVLDENYVFADKGRAMSEKLGAALAAGAYDALDTAEALCERLTGDLQEVSHDKHIRVRYNDEPRPVDVAQESTAEDWEAFAAEGRAVNFGFYKVERLDGNVGYLDLRNFWAAELAGAGETAVGAMNMLSYTDEARRALPTAPRSNHATACAA